MLTDRATLASRLVEVLGMLERRKAAQSPKDGL